MRSRRPGRWIRSARSGPPVRPARRSHPRGGRRGTAVARRLRRAGSARAVPHWARPAPWRGVGWPRVARRGTGWWRSGRGRCEARRVPRTRRGPARRPAACFAARPRHPGRIRASGSSAPGALAGAVRSVPGTRRRPRPAPGRSGRLPLPPPSRHLLPGPCGTSVLYRRRPGGELGGRRAPSFPAPRRLHQWLLTTKRENRNGKDCDERPAERLAGWSGSGPGR